MHLFSDRGTPKSARHIHGFSGHTYKLAKEDGSFVYVKMHFISNQGTDTLTNAEAGETAGESPDSHAADLTGEIEAGNFPSWNLSFQVMTPEEAESYRWNIFDITKVWPHADYPLVPVGKLTLNKNVSTILTVPE
jgi:catalase